MPDLRMQTLPIFPDAAGPELNRTQPLGPKSLLCTSCWYATERGAASSCSACGRPPPVSGWPSLPYSFRNRYAFIAQTECNAIRAVFLARSLGGAAWQQVIVKVARGDAAPESKKAFRREATVAGLLSDNSTTFVGVLGTDNEDPAYIALEHVPWPTLDDLLAQSGVRSSLEVARVGIAILRGVGCLEKQRLVHGNLVPRNVHVSRRDDDTYDIKIAGAGADPPKPEDPLIGAHSSHSYMSPEHWAGEPLSTASDIHMVASILWELATGQLPFPLLDGPPSSAERLSDLREGPQKPAKMPDELYAILARALSFDPADRVSRASQDVMTGENTLAATVEKELQRFLSESSKRQGTARQKLERMSIALADVREQLAPFGGLIGRVQELDAAMRRLGNEPDESKMTSSEVDALGETMREIAAAVDVRIDHGASGRNSVAIESPSSRPNAVSGRSLRSYVLPGLVTALAGFLIGLGVGRAGTDSPSPTALPAPDLSVAPAPSGAPAPRVSSASATSSDAPSTAAPSASVPLGAPPPSEPSAPPSAISHPPDAPSQSPTTAPVPTPRLTGTRPKVDPVDPYGEPKPVPKPGDDPY